MHDDRLPGTERKDPPVGGRHQRHRHEQGADQENEGAAGRARRQRRDEPSRREADEADQRHEDEQVEGGGTEPGVVEAGLVAAAACHAEDRIEVLGDRLDGVARPQDRPVVGAGDLGRLDVGLGAEVAGKVALTLVDPAWVALGHDEVDVLRNDRVVGDPAARHGDHGLRPRVLGREVEGGARPHRVAEHRDAIAVEVGALLDPVHDGVEVAGEVAAELMRVVAVAAEVEGDDRVARSRQAPRERAHRLAVDRVAVGDDHDRGPLPHRLVVREVPAAPRVLRQVDRRRDAVADALIGVRGTAPLLRPESHEQQRGQRCEHRGGDDDGPARAALHHAPDSAPRSQRTPAVSGRR